MSCLPSSCHVITAICIRLLNIFFIAWSNICGKWGPSYTSTLNCIFYELKLLAISIPYCYLARLKVLTFFIKIILSGIISKVCLATTSNKLERPLNRDDEISSVPLSVKPRLPYGMPHWWSFLSFISREQEGGLAIRAAFQKNKNKKKNYICLLTTNRQQWFWCSCVFESVTRAR